MIPILLNECEVENFPYAIYSFILPKNGTRWSSIHSDERPLSISYPPTLCPRHAVDSHKMNLVTSPSYSLTHTSTTSTEWKLVSSHHWCSQQELASKTQTTSAYQMRDGWSFWPVLLQRRRSTQTEHFFSPSKLIYKCPWFWEDILGPTQTVPPRLMAESWSNSLQLSSTRSEDYQTS